MSSQDDITRIVWNLEVPPHTSVSIDTCNHDVETCIEPTPKHDGKLDEDDETEVRLHEGFVFVEDPWHQVLLEPKEALSLLAWLTQEREKLEALAKEQAE